MKKLLILTLVFLTFFSCFQRTIIDDASAQSKVALLRLEDVSPWYSLQENGLNALKWIADYLYSQKVPFQISVIPVYKDPKNNICLGLDDTKDPRIKEFINTIIYMQSRGGVVGIHGYTHQYNGRTALDFEFGINEETSKDEYALERMGKAVNAFKKAGLKFYYWETPHYKASQNQYKTFSKDFSIFFEPDPKDRGSKEPKIYYDLKLDKKPVYFFPAPQDMIHNQNDVNRILSVLNTSPKYICFFLHPFMEFNGVYYADKPGKIKFDLNNRKGYLEQLISGIKGKKYTFTTIIEYTGGKIIRLNIDKKNYTINNELRYLDSPPIIKNSRTLLPIRSIVEELGGTIAWDGTERKVTISFKGTNIELWIDKPTALVNGSSAKIDPNNAEVVPKIINSRTMIPLRFVAESLGCDVQWEGSTRTITVTYPKP